MQVTSHFNLEEFRCGDGTPYPAAWVASRLRPLCEQLELIRILCGNRSVTITSGYRTPEYNRKVGGVKNSQHIEGRAADIKIEGMPARTVAQKTLEAVSAKNLGVKGIGSYASFTHVDIRPAERLAYWFVKSKT